MRDHNWTTKRAVISLASHNLSYCVLEGEIHAMFMSHQRYDGKGWIHFKPAMIKG